MNSAGTHPPICKRREVSACRRGAHNTRRGTRAEGGEDRGGRVARSVPMTLLFHRGLCVSSGVTTEVNSGRRSSALRSTSWQASLTYNTFQESSFWNSNSWRQTSLLAQPEPLSPKYTEYLLEEACYMWCPLLIRLRILSTEIFADDSEPALGDQDP